MDGLGQEGEKMYKKTPDCSADTSMEMNLQFFANKDVAGVDNGEGNGTEAGTDNGRVNNDGTEGMLETDGEVSFDDFLKNRGNQAEFDRRVQQAIHTAVGEAQEKWKLLTDDKVSEAEKLAKMTKEEKVAYIQQKKESDLNAREAELTKRELMAEAKNTLAEKKFPVSLADVLNYSDADSYKKSIEAVEKAFQEAVEVAVEEKLKGGKPPKAVQGQNTVFSQEQVKTMSPEEINKNWDNISKSMEAW